MRQVWTVLLVVAVVTLGGCDKNKKADASGDMPAPPPIEPSPVTSYPEPTIGGSVAPAPAPMPAAPAAGGTYVVQKGDTLWSIAKRTYGDGQRWKDIVNVNPGLTPEKLRVGETIVLP